MLTHANLVTNAYQASRLLTRGGNGKEVMVAALPLFHIFAMTCVMISSVELGGTVVILPRFELRAALNAIRKYRPTMFHGVPTMYVAFNSVPGVERYGFKSLRMCMSGGAALPAEVRQKFEALTGGKLVEGYGLTETSPVTHVNPPEGSPKVASIGLPIPGHRGADHGSGNRHPRNARWRRRRNHDSRSPGHERLLEQAGGNRPGAARRLALHRRHREERRGRLLLHC